MEYNNFTLDIKTIEKNNVILHREASTYTLPTCTLYTVTKFLRLTIEPSCNQYPCPIKVNTIYLTNL